MTILSPENCAYLDRVRPYSEASSIGEAAFYFPRRVERRPWLAHAFTELLRVQHAGRFEPGIGDFRVSDDTLNMAGRVLGSIDHRFLPTPSVSALPGGGLQMTWRNGQEAVEVSVFPGEGVAVAHVIDDMPTSSRELQPADYSIVNGFLGDLIGCTQ